MTKVRPHPQNIVLFPDPMPEEAVADYLIRLFSANGNTWSRPHLFAAGADWAEIESLDAGALAVIERLRGKALPSLAANTPTLLTTKEARIRGHKLHRDMWGTERRRWCPACWLEDLKHPSGLRPPTWNVHRRYWWSLSMIRSCPVHGVKLRDTCPHQGCDRPVFWYVGSHLRCQDGHDLLDAKPEPVKPGTDLADQYLYARFTGRPYEVVPLLENLEFGEAVTVITQFGASALDGEGINLRTRRGSREGEMLSVGLVMAREWPDAFLRRLAVIRAGSGDWGAEKVYGKLYLWARQMGPSPFRDEFHRVFFGYIGETGFVKPNSMPSSYVGDQVTLTTLSRELGISTPSLHRYLVELGHPVEFSSKGHPAVVPEELVETLKSAFDGTLNLREVGARLGISKGRVPEMLAAGLLTEDPVHLQANHAQLRIASKDVDALMAKLVDGKPVIKAAVARRQGLWPISALAKMRGCAGLVDLLLLVLDGTLAVAGLSVQGKGLARLLISRDAVLNAINSEDASKISYREAAETLEMRADDLRLLAKAGVLEGWILVSGRLAISLEALEGFKKEYASIHTLASEASIKPAEMRARLKAHRVRPAIDRHQVHGLKAALYRRDDLGRIS